MGFQNKRGWRNILESRPVLAVLGVLLLFFAWGVFSLLSKMEVTMENRKLVEDHISELEKEKTKLSADIDELKTPEGQEASIREKFGLAKEGEGLIIVVDDKNQSATTEEAATGGFWSFFKNLFSW